MNNEAIEKYVIHNGNIIDVKSYMPYSDFSTNIIYEVIRVIDGIPLFLEEHMDRLLKSSQMLNTDIKHLSDGIASDIKKLIEINSRPEKNIKIFVSKDSSNQINYSVFFIKSSYPESELYKNGIATILFKAVRENPNAKVQNSELREKVNRKLLESNSFEALLLNEADEITEGSKSNVFFVKDDSLYTSPKQKVLLGVTRTRVIDLAKKLSIDVIEEPIHRSFLEECHGLFITGTSPKVLPISSVDNLKYASPQNKTIVKIMSAYDSLIENYIKSHR